MFSHLSASLEGLFSIRLYSAQDRFDGFNRSLIDADRTCIHYHHLFLNYLSIIDKALYSMQVLKTLQALYLDFLASLAVYLSSVVCPL
jgi:hypothetical protein